jgi:hypothetical protein
MILIASSFVYSICLKIVAINGTLLKITSVETEKEALIKDKNRRVQ